MRKKNGLPDRWLAYSNIGKQVKGTRFIAFKVPLGENFLYSLRSTDRFSPNDLVEGHRDLGLVIDLTNTNRYYSSQAIERNGVKHCKLSCPGRMVPTERIVQRFCDIVLDFLSSSAPPDALIGVHCTHGVNRTGYLVCSFMIRHLLMDAREAITAFEEARGHHIERQEYVEALMNPHNTGGRWSQHITPPRQGPSGVSDSWRRARTTVDTWSSNPETATHSRPYKGPWAPTPSPEPEAGPSRKRAPNEPLVTSSRAARKGKRDKRPRNNKQPSTSGTEGEDFRGESWRAANAAPKREAPGYSLHPHGSSDASRNRDQPMREDPDHGDLEQKKNCYWRTPSHLAPFPPQHQPQHPHRPPPGLSTPQFPPSPSPSHPQPGRSTERGFGHGVERERGDLSGSRAAPYAGAWGGGRGRGGSAGGRGGGGRGGGARGGGGGGGGGGRRNGGARGHSRGYGSNRNRSSGRDRSSGQEGGWGRQANHQPQWGGQPDQQRSRKRFYTQTHE